ncbi:MAG: prolipoprotein diacylglyceryl transferase [Acidimicrobiia bacterium]
MEFTLLAAAAAAFVLVIAELAWERRHEVPGSGRDLVEIAFTAAVTGMLAGRLAAMVGDGVNPMLHPADILIVRGGVATGPASLGALAWIAWAGRHRLWQVADGLSAAALAGLAGWHAGCLARHACLGTPSDLPWAYAQRGGGVTRHPVELYAAVLLAVAAVAIALWRWKRPPRPGVAASLALAAAGAVRLVTEPLRPSLAHEPVAWYLAAVVAGLGVAWWRARRPRRGTSPAP